MNRPELRSFACPESSNVAMVTYRTDNKRLRVTFKNGVDYDYFEVPFNVYVSLRRAESVGSAFDSLVKKGGYAFSKVGPPRA